MKNIFEFLAEFEIELHGYFLQGQLYDETVILL